MRDGPRRILLIDDDEDSYVLTRELLRQIDPHGYELHWAETYEAGLREIQQATHDVYLVDYRLGARDGLELLREALAGGCHAPIIMLTGQGDQEVDREAMQTGAMDYLVKDELAVGPLERSIRHALERQRLLNALKQAAENLERSNAELEQFAYVASHDLQAPLRQVQSYCELLQLQSRGQLDAEASEYVGYIMQSAAGMQRLIQDLLRVARVGKQGKPFQPTDCTTVLDEVLKNLEPAIREHHAVVTREPLPTVLADRTQLLQLFQNLIGNALHYRAAQPPRIQVSAERHAGEWLFSVRDNGLGIAPEHHREVFIMFKRLHTSEERSGTGIGLAICQRIVERHGGRIWVESELGQGSTFLFTLPDQAAQP